MIIWVVGLSGSGKTTIGREMFHRLEGAAESEKWVFLDGDDFRMILGEDLGHEVEDRRKNSRRIQNLCHFLDRQGINVVACILSIFPDHRDENRRLFSGYRELYVRCTAETLRRRDNKDLYGRAERGELASVVGVQIPFPEPLTPDGTIDNDLDGVHPTDLAAQALAALDMSVPVQYPYTSIDRLDTPFKYEYTRFEGHDLLDAYQRQRQQAIDTVAASLRDDVPVPATDGQPGTRALDLAAFLARSLPAPLRDQARTSNLASVIPEIDAEALTLDVEVDGVFRTARYLADRLDRLRTGEWAWTDERATTLALLQRFEVSKKVDRTYAAPSLKRAERDWSDLRLYPLLSIYFSRASTEVDEHVGAILVNAALKLGDILTSAVSRFESGGERMLVLAALHDELSATRGFIDAG